MKIDKLAYIKGKKFFSIIKEDTYSSELNNILLDFIYYSRLYHNIWDKNFYQGFLKDIKQKDSEIYKDFYSQFFKDYYKISQEDLDNIKYIVSNKKQITLIEKNNDNFENIFDFLFYKRTLFFKKNLYNLVYFFSQIPPFSDKDNLFSFIESINKISLTQKIFKIENKEYTFHVLKNKGPFYCFWINKKLVTLDPFISYYFNKKIQNNSLITSFLFNDENPKNIQKNIIDFHKEYSTIYPQKTNQIIDNLNNISPSNILHFCLEDLETYSGIMSMKDETILKSLSNENNFINNHYLPEHFYEILFMKKSFINNIYTNNIEKLEIRKKWINKIFRSLFIDKEFNKITHTLNKIDHKILYNIYLNTIKKINYIYNNYGHTFKDSLFYEFCFDSSENFQTFIINIDDNYKNNNNPFSHIFSKEDQTLLFNALYKLLQTS